MNSITKAAGLALMTFTLGGTVARAADGAGDGMEQMKKHTAAMSQGMSHDEATKASTRLTDDGTATQEVQQKHAAAMAKGMSHDEARKASAAPIAPADVKKANTRAKKHAEAMGKGKSHDEARKAAGDM